LLDDEMLLDGDTDLAERGDGGGVLGVLELLGALPLDLLPGGALGVVDLLRHDRHRGVDPAGEDLAEARLVARAADDGDGRHVQVAADRVRLAPVDRDDLFAVDAAEGVVGGSRRLPDVRDGQEPAGSGHDDDERPGDDERHQPTCHGESLDGAGGHGVPTHSDVPSAKSCRFQIGTEARRSSISLEAAANASPRCGAAAATTTAASPISSSPTRCSAARACTGRSAATFSATWRSTSSAVG